MITTRSVGHMSSFISVNALKLFKTNAFFLKTTDNGTGLQMLINIFPPNLEKFYLTCFQACYGPQLEAIEYQLGQKSRHQIPSLRYLIVEDIKDFEAGPSWSNAQETAVAR